MDIQALETFIDLMETRSFNRTAERLGIRQSTASHRVRALEGELGRQLFVRSRAGTEPTAAGLKFLDHARELRQQWHEALRQVRVGGGYSRTLRIGMQHDIADRLASRAVADIRTALPEATIYLEVDYSIQMAEDLLSGEMDIALAFTPRYAPQLHIAHLGALRYRMVSTETDRRDELTPSRYVMPNISPAFEREHRRFYPDLTDAPLACGQSRAIAALLGELGGSSYVSEAIAAELCATGAVRMVDDADPIDQPVYLALNARNRHRPAHAKAAAVLRSIGPTHGIAGPPEGEPDLAQERKAARAAGG